MGQGVFSKSRIIFSLQLRVILNSLEDDLNLPSPELECKVFLPKPPKEAPAAMDVYGINQKFDTKQAPESEHGNPIRDNPESSRTSVKA